MTKTYLSDQPSTLIYCQFESNPLDFNDVRRDDELYKFI